METSRKCRLKLTPCSEKHTLCSVLSPNQSTKNRVHLLEFKITYKNEPIQAYTLCLPPSFDRKPIRRPILWPVGMRSTNHPSVVHLGTSVIANAIQGNAQDVWNNVGVIVARLPSGNRAPTLHGIQMYRLKAKTLPPPPAPALIRTPPGTALESSSSSVHTVRTTSSSSTA